MIRRMGWFEGKNGWAKAGLVFVYIALWVVSAMAISVTLGELLGYLVIVLLLTSPFSGLYQGLLKVFTHGNYVWKRYLLLPAGLHIVLMVTGALAEEDFLSWSGQVTGWMVLSYGIMAAQALLADWAVNQCLELG